MNKNKKTFTLASPILLLIVSIGPIGWTIIDILNGKIDRLLILFIISIVLTVFDTILWCCYFNMNNTIDDEVNE